MVTRRALARAFGGHRHMAAVLVVTICTIGSVTCGPRGDRAVQGEELLAFDDPGWRLSDVSLSPRGRWAAVAATSSTHRPGFRLFVLDLESHTTTEAEPTADATARILTEPNPGTRVMEWTEAGLRFPAPRVEPTYLRLNLQTLKTYLDEGIALGSPSWYFVPIASGEIGKLELDESMEAAERQIPIPANVDSRLDVLVRSRSSFDLIDRENGGRLLARFRAPGTKIQLFTAKFSPDESWIGLTVRREASFSLGERAFLVERSTGRELGRTIVEIEAARGRAPRCTAGLRPPAD